MPEWCPSVFENGMVRCPEHGGELAHDPIKTPHMLPFHWTCPKAPPEVERQKQLEVIATALGDTPTEPLFGSLPARMLSGGPPQPGFTVEHAASRIAICRGCEHLHPTAGCDGKLLWMLAKGKDCERQQRWAETVLALKQREPCPLWKDPPAEAYRKTMKGE